MLRGRLLRQQGQVPDRKGKIWKKRRTSEESMVSLKGDKEGHDGDGFDFKETDIGSLLSGKSGRET